jgi:hypothetical protein
MSLSISEGSILSPLQLFPSLITGKIPLLTNSWRKCLGLIASLSAACAIVSKLFILRQVSSPVPKLTALRLPDSLFLQPLLKFVVLDDSSIVVGDANRVS